MKSDDELVAGLVAKYSPDQLARAYIKASRRTKSRKSSTTVSAKNSELADGLKDLFKKHTGRDVDVR